MSYKKIEEYCEENIEGLKKPKEISLNIPPDSIRIKI